LVTVLVGDVVDCDDLAIGSDVGVRTTDGQSFFFTKWFQVGFFFAFAAIAGFIAV
jgi:hypothetical protein